MRLFKSLLKVFFVVITISPFLYGIYFYFFPTPDKSLKVLLKSNLFFVVFFISFAFFLFYIAYYVIKFGFKESDRIKRIEKTLIFYFFLFGIIYGAFFGWVIGSVETLIGIQSLRFYKPKVPTRIYDVKNRLIAEIFKEHRIPVRIEDIPKSVIKVFLTVEDRNFFKHIGVDFSGIIRAFIRNIFAGKITQGGSTITQQLAKKLFTKGERTLYRKILEVWLALQLERKFSKMDILEMYFNHIYFGAGAYGIEAASRLYFNKSVKELSLPEAAILARLPAAPNKFSPLRNPSIAKKYNKIILLTLAKEGYISKYDALRLHKEFWDRYEKQLRKENPFKTAWSIKINKAPYFVDYVIQKLKEYLGTEDVYSGLVVYTTLDLDVQKIAEKNFLEGIKIADKKSKLLERHYYSIVDKRYKDIYDFFRHLTGWKEIDSTNKNINFFRAPNLKSIVDAGSLFSLIFGREKLNRYLESMSFKVYGEKKLLDVEGALVSINPKNGYIVAMIGGRKYSEEDQFNRATKARRQPGSAFKPFVYLTALDLKAITPATLISDTPMRNVKPSGEFWEPKNYSKTYRGYIRIRDALTFSVNIASIKVYDRIGGDVIVDYASRMMRIPKSRFAVDPSLALGTSELTPLELATGYSVIANDGKEVIPIAIRYITDVNGEEILDREDQVRRELIEKDIHHKRQIIPQRVAWLITDIMKDVVDRGTAAVIRDYFVGDAAGKTGTSSDWNDAWFCGFTRDLVTVIWIGYDKNLLSLGEGNTGGELAAPIWGKMYRELYKNRRVPHFPPPPAGIYSTEICSFTGKIPSPTCPTMMEYFLQGTGPNGHCDGKHEKFLSIEHLLKTKELLFKIQKSGIKSLSYMERRFLNTYGSRIYDNIRDMIKVCDKIYREGMESLSQEEKKIIAPLYESELQDNF